MNTIEIDCLLMKSEDEFWDGYLAAVNAQGAGYFGRNLNAFWDAIQRGGPGAPGVKGYPDNLQIVFKNSGTLATFKNYYDSKSFLDHLIEIANEATSAELIFA